MKTNTSEKVSKTNPMSRFYQPLLPAAIVIALLGAAPARADIVVNVQSVIALAGSTGNSLEVYLTNTGAPVTIDGFAFGLSVPSTDINFTSVTTSTSVDAYIFAGNSLFGPEIDSPPASGQSVSASDLWGGAGDGFTVGSGATVGLGEVFFDVAAGASGGPLSLSFIGAETSLSDINGASIAISTENPATITVPVSAVPEPWSVTLLGLVIAPLLWRRKLS